MQNVPEPNTPDWPAGALTCGDATMRLLWAHGVDTVFGIPGVHTLEFCRGLADVPIHHVQPRNEQGAGFMADGYARVSGRPGVALVISGPGVTNALTAVGQAFADSIPLLLLSSETDSGTHGKGWGVLHEIPDQRAVTDPLTALSLRASRPTDVPELLAQAFGVFASRRPRPVHISIPIDVLAMPVEPEDFAGWKPRSLPHRPLAHPDDVSAAARMLGEARLPLVMVGGGAVDAAASVRALVEELDAPVVASNAGKGVVPDDHPLSLSASTVRPEVQSWLAAADVILAVGTELSETDSFVDALDLNGRLIRIDIDATKINDQYPATLGLVADAGPTVEAIVAAGGFVSEPVRRSAREREVAALHQAIGANLTSSQHQHVRLLRALEEGLSDETIFAGDVCQLVYTGGFAMPRRRPRTWTYPAGYCSLGCGLPNAIGAKFALPDRDIVCLAGDGGFMFTVQELIVAAEEGLGIPIVIWANGGLRQIQDDMRAQSIDPVGVTGRNPDFVMLARSMGADGVIAEGLDQVLDEVRAGFGKDRPTLVVVEEDAAWLTGAVS